MRTGRLVGLRGVLLSLLTLAVAGPPAFANGVPEHRPPPPPPPKIPCCYVEHQLGYARALRAAWGCTLAKGAEGAQKPHGLEVGSAKPERDCWYGAFESRCALGIFETYPGVAPVSGPHHLLNRLNREIAWLEGQREDCDSAPAPDHPLLPYCRHYCDAPELYGHSVGAPAGPGEPSGDRPGRAPAE